MIVYARASSLLLLYSLRDKLRHKLSFVIIVIITTGYVMITVLSFVRQELYLLTGCCSQV